MNAVINTNTDVAYYINTVNELIVSIEKSAKNLFETFHSAYETLSNDDFENKFIPAIDMDKSSINKMKKICQSDFIMNNRDKLPTSWATLYVLVNIDEDELQQLIDSGELTTNTTKKQMLELRDKINSPIVEEEYDNLIGIAANDSDYDDTEGDNSTHNRDKHWVGMPEFNNPGSDSEIYRKLIIRFKEETDFDDFLSKMDNLNLTDKTKSVWYESANDA